MKVNIPKPKLCCYLPSYLPSELAVLTHRLPLGKGMWKDYTLLENEWESISKDKLCKVTFSYSKIKQAFCPGLSWDRVIFFV